MEKIFKVGEELESGCAYTADRKVYDIYASDAVEVCSPRYISLRARSDPHFLAFVYLKDKKDIILDFGGADIVLHGKIQPFLFDHCENVTVKNCNILFSRPPYTELDILERGDGYLRTRPIAACPCRVEEENLIPYAEEWECRTLNFRGYFFQVYDPKDATPCGSFLGGTGDFKHSDDFPFPIITFKAKQDGEDVLLYGDAPEYCLPGRVLEIEHEKRDLSSICAVDCRNVSVKNYRIVSGLGMGMYFIRTHNITLDGYALYHDEKSPCVISNSADALHTFACSGKFIIKNSIFENMMDDALNVHSNFHTLREVSGNVLIADVASVERQAQICFDDGDTIAVYNGPTMEKTGEYKILKAEDVEKGVRRFILDRPADGHKKGDLIENISANTDLEITNCRFGKANTHLRFQTRGKITVQGCVSELPFCLTGDASYWFESGPVQDMTVENCRFIGDRAALRICSEVMPTEKAPYYHRNIRLIGNEFASDVPVSGGYADHIVFTGNKNTAGVPMRLELTNCGDVTADNCEVVRKTEEKTSLKVN